MVSDYYVLVTSLTNTRAQRSWLRLGLEYKWEAEQEESCKHQFRNPNRLRRLSQKRSAKDQASVAP